MTFALDANMSPDRLSLVSVDKAVAVLTSRCWERSTEPRQGKWRRLILGLVLEGPWLAPPAGSSSGGKGVSFAPGGIWVVNLRFFRRVPASGVAVVARAAYQTRQEFTGYMGCPLVQPKAFPNSSKFCTEPLTRHLPGECGSTRTRWRATCSVWFWHQTWAKPMK